MGHAEKLADAALRTATPQHLIKVFKMLSARIHEADAKVTAGTGPRKGSYDYVVSGETSRALDRLLDLRAQRDLIEAELLRRMGAGS